jgi:hypothetical protein
MYSRARMRMTVTKELSRMGVYLLLILIKVYPSWGDPQTLKYIDSEGI